MLVSVQSSSSRILESTLQQVRTVNVEKRRLSIDRNKLSTFVTDEEPYAIHVDVEVPSCVAVLVHLDGSAHTHMHVIRSIVDWQVCL